MKITSQKRIYRKKLIDKDEEEVGEEEGSINEDSPNKQHQNHHSQPEGYLTLHIVLIKIKCQRFGRIPETNEKRSWH